MMKTKYLYIIAIFVLSISCDDYLDIEPKGKRIPRTIEDYDLALPPITTLEIEKELFLTADDFVAETSNLGDLTDPDNNKLHLFTYSDKRFSNPDIGSQGWNSPYKNLYAYNKIINEIDDAEDAITYTEEDRLRIKAEAQYGRAVQYFFLVNMFAKHYNLATAKSDLAVPIVLKASTVQKTPPRATVEEVYNLILKDLNEAISNLPQKRKGVNRPSKGSGYALLARVYLFQGKYDLALKNAELALQENSQLSDYTTATNINKSYADEQYSVLFYGYVRGFTDGIVSEELLALFDQENDIRITKIAGCTWVNDPNTGWYKDCSKKSNGYAIEPNPLPSVAEMYAIAAECYARTGNTAKTLEKLNQLRKHRIKEVTDKTASEFTTPDALVKFALEERRRELFMSGMRLFDLKRLNLDSKYAKIVKHIVKDEVYEADPNSGKLVLPIPEQVKKFNPDF